MSLRTSGPWSGALGWAGVNPVQRHAQPKLYVRCSRRGSPSGRATDGYGVRRTVQAPQQCVGSLAVHLRGPPCPSARRAVFVGSQAFTHARQLPFGPGTSRTSPQRGVVGTFIPIPPRLWTSSPPFPFNCLFDSAATPTALPGRLGVGLADLSGFSNIALPSTYLRESSRRHGLTRLRVPRVAPERGCHGTCVPSRSVSDLAVFCGLAGFLLSQLPECCIRPRS